MSHDQSDQNKKPVLEALFQYVLDIYLTAEG